LIPIPPRCGAADSLERHRGGWSIDRVWAIFLTLAPFREAQPRPEADFLHEFVQRDFINRADLGDRAIVVTLAPIANADRRRRRSFGANSKSPVSASSVHSSTGLARHGSQASAAHGRFRALGRRMRNAFWPGGTFAGAYAANWRAAIESIADASVSPLTPVRRIVSTVSIVRGTAHLSEGTGGKVEETVLTMLTVPTQRRVGKHSAKRTVHRTALVLAVPSSMWLPQGLKHLPEPLLGTDSARPPAQAPNERAKSSKITTLGGSRRIRRGSAALVSALVETRHQFAGSCLAQSPPVPRRPCAYKYQA
jgi:hypothetical protein